MEEWCRLDRLCACLNKALQADGRPFLALWPAQSAECLADLRRDDLSVEEARSPEYALVHRLRRSDGAVWNTQVGGADVLTSRALVAWAAQAGAVLTAEAAIAVLEG